MGRQASLTLTLTLTITLTLTLTLNLTPTLTLTLTRCGGLHTGRGRLGLRAALLRERSRHLGQRLVSLHDMHMHVPMRMHVTAASRRHVLASFCPPVCHEYDSFALRACG